MYISRQPNSLTITSENVSKNNDWKFYEYARHGMIDGLMALNVKKILIPNFICNVVSEELKRQGIDFDFYEIDPCFNSNFKEIEEKLKTGTFQALLNVCYFGIPNEVNEHRNICEKYNVKFILDNAHGFGGKFNKLDLMDIGDLSFTSIRKILNLNTGAIARFNGETNYSQVGNVQEFKMSRLKKYLLNNYLFRKAISKRRFNKMMISQFEEMATQKYLEADSLDGYIKLALETKKIRDSIYQKYHGFFARYKNISLRVVSSECDPMFWVFPIVFNTQIDRDNALRASFEAGFDSFTWPSLPVEINHHELFDRLLCLPINPEIDIFDYDLVLTEFLKSWLP